MISNCHVSKVPWQLYKVVLWMHTTHAWQKLHCSVECWGLKSHTCIQGIKQTPHQSLVKRTYGRTCTPGSTDAFIREVRNSAKGANAPESVKPALPALGQLANPAATQDDNQAEVMTNERPVPTNLSSALRGRSELKQSAKTPSAVPREVSLLPLHF